jgi:hypothetical protein
LRRFFALLVLVVALIAAGAGWAGTITGTRASEVLRGTPGSDSIFGRAGNDAIYGLGGDDLLDGGLGADHLLGGPGNDRVAAQGDGSRDRVLCGPGQDVVNVEGRDVASADCEVVARRISRAVGDIAGQAQAEVEPDSLSWGKTVVSVFQVGRFADGGAAAIGWARSRNGRTWRAGLLPGVRPGRSGDTFVSDPVITYDAAHARWLAATLRSGENGDDLIISSSRDGLSWRRPRVAAQARAETFDKPWIACDDWRSSGFRGHCYLSDWNVRDGVIEIRSSLDGGVKWSQPVGLVGTERANGQVNGAQPLVQPDGTLVVVYLSYSGGFADVLLAARSIDGGRTFEAPVRVAGVSEQDVFGMRSPLLPSATVDAGGRIYVAWHECGLRADCSGDDIVLTSSSDGVAWAAARRVPTALGFPADSDYFTPGLSVSTGTSGARAHLAITYYVMPPPCGLGACGVDVGIVESTNGGATWRVPQRLNAQPMPLDWIADGGFGHMLADYISTSWAGGRPVAVFALASQLHGEQFRQSIFAARPPIPALRKAARAGPEARRFGSRAGASAS